MLAQVTEILTAADRAADQGFKWWFAALLIGVLMAGLGLFWYNDKERKVLREECRELRNECKEGRKEVDAVRKEFTDHLKVSNTQLATTLSDTQKSLTLFAETIASVKHLFKA